MTETLKPIITAAELNGIVCALARRITLDYASKTPVMIGLLKGSFIFMADLVRAITIPVEVDFIRTSRYGMSDTPSNEAAVTMDTELDIMDIKGRDVLLVDEIIDRGRTVEGVLARLRTMRPASVKLMALLMRRNAGVEPPKPDYLGTTIGEGFVVGYGLDSKERYRNLPDICVIEEGKGG
jgi:hypoxanthine phosphoribosyltransferase